MQVQQTSISDLLILMPKVHQDNRGLFFESWNARKFKEATGVEATFVQDNHSKSTCGVLRGLHYQLQRPQGKLVRVVSGRVLDVAVDLRASSQTFGHHVKVELSSDNQKQLWIPPGFAHGFLVLSEWAELLYKTTEFYDGSDEFCLRWNDPSLKIDWNLRSVEPELSIKDQAGKTLSELPTFE